MKHVVMLPVLAMLALPTLGQTAQAAGEPRQVNACVTQMTDKNITDRSSAQKVCACVVNEQANITQAQKSEIDTWVKNGKDVRQNKTYQTIVAKLKACGNGIKFNKPIG